MNKYCFTLNNLNIDRINHKYGIYLDTNNESKIEKTTLLTKLNNKNSEVFSFLDESKKKHTCNISMIDFNSKKHVNLLRYNCFWCKNPFDTYPVGCPIRYVSNQIVKKYKSYISKDTYIITENTNKKDVLYDNMRLIDKNYYETDGVFCSFNCCYSYIEDNTHNHMYIYSKNLLIKIYNEMMGTQIETIIPAPHWRTLIQYGGHLNIMKFRDNFNKIEYEYQGTTRQIPKFISLGLYFEKKINFN